MMTCRRCKWRPVRYYARRGLCEPCRVAVDAERAARLCRSCEVRIVHGRTKFCKVCRAQGVLDLSVPDRLPTDFAQRQAAIDAANDPLALALVCHCGAPVSLEGRYMAWMQETRFFEVCARGHETPMRRHGRHTYDQHERAAAEGRRQDEITARARVTRERHGVRFRKRGTRNDFRVGGRV